MTTPNPPAASQQAAVEAALLILERMGLSPGDLTPSQRPHARADVRRVRPGRVRRGDRRHPEGVRQLLEPRHRAVGRPAAWTNPRRRRSGSS